MSEQQTTQSASPNTTSQETLQSGENSETTPSTQEHLEEAKTQEEHGDQSEGQDQENSRFGVWTSLVGLGFGAGVLLVVVLGIWWFVTGHVISTQRVFSGPKDGISGVGVSGDGKIVTASSHDGLIYVWKGTGEKLRTLDSQAGAATCMAMSADGKILVAGDLAAARVWDLTTGTLLHRLDSLRGNVKAIALSPDKSIVATTSEAPGLPPHMLRKNQKREPDWIIELWSVETGERVGLLAGHTKKVRSLAFGPQGKYLVSGGGDMVRVWDVSAGVQVKEIAISGDSGSDRSSPDVRGLESGVDCVAFSPDGKRIASVGEDNIIRVWDWESKNETLAIAESPGKVQSVVFGRDGRYLFSGSLRKFGLRNPEEKKSRSRTIQGWNVVNGTEQFHFDREEIGVLSLAVSPNGRYLVAAGDDERVYLFRIP
ncbi:MAG: WD40 repeat domain-containing protein [Gemmataceae bacterium]